MDSRAQVSFEYLLTTLFGIILAIAAAILIQSINAVAQDAQARILTYRQDTISSLMGT